MSHRSATGRAFGRTLIAIVMCALALAGCAGAGPMASTTKSAVVATRSSAPSPSAEPTSCSSTDALTCLTDAVDAGGRAGDFAGVILIAKDGTEVWHAAFGADTTGVPYDLETRFDVHSVTKMFTAVAIAQLVKAHRLSFADRLDRFVDPVWADSNDATIAELLTHTAGLAGARGSFHYSNTDFDILGRIIERATGGPYQDFVATHVFGPAAMTSTGPATEPALGLPASAVGQRSTATDLERFMEALAGGDLLDAETTELITTGQVATDWDPAVSYGYGFTVFGSGEDRSVGHLGSSGDVVKAAVLMNAGLGMTMVVLCDFGYEPLERPIITYLSDIGMPYWS